MKVLLDTHVFLWWNTTHGSRVSEVARALIEDPSNEVLVSAASAWEMAIKSAAGRLQLPSPVARYVPDRLRRSGFAALPVQLDHALRTALLPSIHTDPFDRLLVAQAQAEDLPIITADPLIGRYDVETIW